MTDDDYFFTVQEARRVDGGPIVVRVSVTFPPAATEEQLDAAVAHAYVMLAEETDAHFASRAVAGA